MEKHNSRYHKTELLYKNKNLKCREIKIKLMCDGKCVSRKYFYHKQIQNKNFRNKKKRGKRDNGKSKTLQEPPSQKRSAQI